jgi:predicted Holliday junction resolvase-like endonuclease
MVLTMTDIQLFQILKQKLGEKEAEALVTFVDAKLKVNNEANLKVIATREDVVKLKGDLETKISETRSDIIRWVFGIFVVLMLAIIGLYFKNNLLTKNLN